MAKLKVFRATLGFFETVVAVPSKKAALDAWGARQDLFATGAAEPVTDTAAAEAALARPGVVLRRPVGSQGAFEADASLAGIQLPPPPKRSADSKKAGKANAKPDKPKPPPDRTALSQAETALAARQARYAREREALEAKRKALEEQADALRDAFDQERQALEAARAEAAEAYRKAGG